MAKRARAAVAPTNSYFTSAKTNIQFVSTGCAVLDCALGGGLALGRTANVVGDKCLSGETIVRMKRGLSRPRKITIKELYNRVNGNHFNKNQKAITELLSDVGGYVATQPLVSVQKTGKKILYEVVTQWGNSIKASRDHKFLTDIGWKTLATGLSVGSTIISWQGKKTGKQVKVRRAVTRNVRFHPFGWKSVTAGINYQRMLTARLVLEADLNKIDLNEFIKILRHEPKRAAELKYSNPALDVHHKDGDPLNDTLSNLELLSKPSHWATHASDMAKDTNRTTSTKIISITKIGYEDTFDITMKAPHHNFIANGFVVHNSTAKTGTATEVMINFTTQFPEGQVAYRETEAAWDNGYAEAMGLPLVHIDFGDPEAPIITVEDFYSDFDAFCDKQIKAKRPGLYVLDSFDALSDEAEMERDIDKASFGAAKAKKMSEMFRKITRKQEKANVLLLIVSQVRDNIGALFGEKHKRSGGKALDFYASQVFWLAHTKILKRTINKVERPYGIELKAKVKKNKVGMPFREAEFSFEFGFGINDLLASVNWLDQVDRLDAFGIKKTEYKDYIKEIADMPTEEYAEERKRAADAVKLVWAEVEETHMPKRRKYA